jgi:hypothetical protein
MKAETITTFVENNSKEGNVVILKVEPVPRFCCCSHCVPEFWTEINNEIHSQKPIEHEGVAILTLNNEKFLLEQHESGPELLAFLEAVNTIYNFAKLLLPLSIDSFARKGAAKIKVTKRIMTTRQKLVAEEIFEIEISDKSKNTLDKIISKIIKE